MSVLEPCKTNEKYNYKKRLILPTILFFGSGPIRMCENGYKMSQTNHHHCTTVTRNIMTAHKHLDMICFQLHLADHTKGETYDLHVHKFQFWNASKVLDESVVHIFNRVPLSYLFTIRTKWKFSSSWGYSPWFLRIRSGLTIWRDARVYSVQSPIWPLTCVHV